MNGDDYQDIKEYFDYDTPHHCQYPVPSKGTPESEMDCGEPAPHRGYWVNAAGEITSEMWLCSKHLNIILKGPLQVGQPRTYLSQQCPRSSIGRARAL